MVQSSSASRAAAKRVAALASVSPARASATGPARRPRDRRGRGWGHSTGSSPAPRRPRLERRFAPLASHHQARERIQRGIAQEPLEPAEEQRADAGVLRFVELEGHFQTAGEPARGGAFDASDRAAAGQSGKPIDHLPIYGRQLLAVFAARKIVQPQNLLQRRAALLAIAQRKVIQSQMRN